MKIVFSKEKYIEDRRSNGIPEEDIQHHLNSWANECEGLTLEEMLSRGCYADHDWLIEVPDDKKLDYEKIKKENEELKKEIKRIIEYNHGTDMLVSEYEQLCKIAKENQKNE